MNPVLYDAPGPRARRVTLIASIAAAVVVLVGVYFLIYLPLDENGQFTEAKWGPLLDPSNKDFALLWTRIRLGLQATLLAAVLAIVASLVLGSLLGVVRLQLQVLRRRHFAGLALPAALSLRVLNNGLNGLTRVFVEVFRGLPVVITIFFVGRVLPEFGIRFNPLWYVVIGLTFYNGVVIAEILRSGMSGLPGGQREAANAIGLSSFQTLRLILLPQAYRIMLPALISQLIVILKDTSLGFIVSYEDLLRVANQIIAVLGNPIPMYVVIGLIYLLINYGLSKLAGYVQRRLAQGRRSPGPAPQLPPSTVDAAANMGMSSQGT